MATASFTYKRQDGNMYFISYADGSGEAIHKDELKKLLGREPGNEGSKGTVPVKASSSGWSGSATPAGVAIGWGITGGIVTAILGYGFLVPALAVGGARYVIAKLRHEGPSTISGDDRPSVRW